MVFDIKTMHKAIESLAAEKDINPAHVKEAVEEALASAYKKEYNRRGQIIKATLDDKTGEVSFVQIKTVVDPKQMRYAEEETQEEGEEKKEGYSGVSAAQKTEQISEERVNKQKDEGTTSEEEEKLPLYNAERHLFLDEAKKIKKDAALEDEIIFELESPQEDFGRIAAQTAKQVVLQKLREIEREAVRGEFENRVGELVTGIVQRIERGNVYADLGKTTGVMFFSEGIPGEHYRIGERLRFYLLAVQEGGRGPMLSLSRSHPKFISKLFELEVPEISDGIVQVKGIVREPGNRTKIAVDSTAEGVDPVGACVGQRGARVMAVNNEIGNERIDIIEWSEDVAHYIASALSPAVVTTVEMKNNGEALVLVPEDQLSLAIGKGGQNVRLAARLTGWKIDVRSQSNPQEQQEGGAVSEDEMNNRAILVDEENQEDEGSDSKEE